MFMRPMTSSFGMPQRTQQCSPSDTGSTTKSNGIASFLSNKLTTVFDSSVGAFEFVAYFRVAP